MLHFAAGSDRLRHLWTTWCDSSHRIPAGAVLDPADRWTSDRGTIVRPHRLVHDTLCPRRHSTTVWCLDHVPHQMRQGRRSGHSGNSIKRSHSPAAGANCMGQ
uniref:(northern house mosquito) hypothetical protein n=1 Tax=Culex pipiens TaxID=7175 RepID=A0A8D8B1T3_CULPI